MWPLVSLSQLVQVNTTRKTKMEEKINCAMLHAVKIINNIKVIDFKFM